MKTDIQNLRAAALHAIGRGVPSSLIELRASASAGGKLSQAATDELLAKAVKRERVSVVLEVLSYEQGRRTADGTVLKNRNGVRIRDGAMMSLGRSGKGTPFLRDHQQHDSTAVSGIVLESTTQKIADGHYQVLQVVELTEPAAVERALRGLMHAVSVGLEPLGPVNCTACGSEVFTKCFHFPFDVVTQDGKSIEIEWEFTQVGLRETSEVPIPAVQHAAIQEIRTTLAAQFPGVLDVSAANFRGTPARKNDPMDPEVLAALGLPSTATSADVLAAVAALGGTNVSAREDEFIRTAIASGRLPNQPMALAGKDNEVWRAAFRTNPTRAAEMMSAIPTGSVTPIGLPRQSDQRPVERLGAPPVIEVAPGAGVLVRERAAELAQVVQQLAHNPRAAAWAAKFGLQSRGRFDLPTQLAATSIANISGDLDAARIGFHATFLDTLGGEPDPVFALATEIASSNRVENYAWIGDLPGMREWTADRVLNGLSAYGFAIANRKWEASFRLLNDDIADDRVGLLAPLISDMGANARLHPGILVAQLLLNGFAGTAFPEHGNGKAFDGELFFATTHATGSNKLAVAFSAANLPTAAALLRQQKRFDGGNLYAKGTHLFVGIAEEALAEKVLAQETLASGESNTQKGKYELVVTPEFADGEWALADLSRAVKPMLFQNREPISTQAIGGRGSNDQLEFVKDECWLGARARYNAGYFDFRRIVGSKP